MDPSQSNYHYIQRLRESKEDTSDVEVPNIIIEGGGITASRSRRHGRGRGNGLIPVQENWGSKTTADYQNDIDKSFPSSWIIYCWALTWWIPTPLMRLCGMPDKDRQLAWREKIGLISIILYLAAFIAFLTFGFTKTVCRPNSITLNLANSTELAGYILINGQALNASSFIHPKVAGISKKSNILFPPINAGGNDLSFLFQNVNGNCKGLITPKHNCTIPFDDDDNLAWYFPCRVFDPDGSTKPNFTDMYYNGWSCHTSIKSRKNLYDLHTVGGIYLDWVNIKNSSRNLVVYNGDVLDLDLLHWLDVTNLDYPKIFDDLQNDKEIRGHDISLQMTSYDSRRVANCLRETIKIGIVSSTSIGCISSKVVLVVSLAFILAIVIIKFLFACYFHWFVAGRQGAFYMDNKSMNERSNQLEEWSNNQNSQGPIQTVTSPSGKKRLSTEKEKWYERKHSKFSTNYGKNQMVTMSTQSAAASEARSSIHSSKRKSAKIGVSPLVSTSLSPISKNNQLQTSPLQSVYSCGNQLSFESIHSNVVPQPPLEFQPFGYPLPHVLLLITAYSESIEGLRTTCDSLATTDYPNSHKLLVIICDGIIKGSGNDQTTPDICLDMMEDFSIPKDEVLPHSYIAVAKGTKRHNMAKVYSGFYKYDNNTVPLNKQQRVPVVCIVKCGTPEEDGTSKPGNRGKRDTQIILMSFLQHLMFDERMTRLEFEILSNIWSITGLFADLYEIILMVDADTKVYPDSLTHMVAEMVKDPMIMGLCGETKISNKSQSWVTAIQVFEYYISHHQAKAFESIFGGVTCLPGCFCMYRIKAPKGSSRYWVPILASPDIVERYADNVTDSLHKKNLLLLGEDRYLTSLMLRAFPKRKQIFVPKACCKTIVPDEFFVLLSQRRRWINSTVHNLMELVLVKDLCGVFCFSMQFVVFIELMGTLVLPAAIAFTLYVIVIAFIDIQQATLSLILLAMILGLPGVLIIITAARWSYVVWMFIYLCALIIWNFVLPTYAFWKFDDFSWGQTREIAGGDAANKGHDQGEGKFDASKIVMKHWKEFERERINRSDDDYVTLIQPQTIWDRKNNINVYDTSDIDTDDAHVNVSTSKNPSKFRSDIDSNSLQSEISPELDLDIIETSNADAVREGLLFNNENFSSISSTIASYSDNSIGGSFIEEQTGNQRDLYRGN